jgi:hypothetical protein
MTPNTDDLQVHASRILALAIEAVENGKINTVDELTALASHYLDEAIAIERLCALSGITAVSPPHLYKILFTA